MLRLLYTSDSFYTKSHRIRCDHACLSGAVGSVIMHCLATMIGESGFEAQACQIIVSGYCGVCFEIKFSGRPRGFDGVLFNL